MSANVKRSPKAGIPLWVRIALVVAAVTLAASARIDELVAVASRTGWIPPEVFAFRVENETIEQNRVVQYCDVNECLDLRLPVHMIVVYGIISLLCTVAVVAVLAYAASRLLRTKNKDGTTIANPVPPTNAVHNSIIAVAALGIVLTFVRITGAVGKGYYFAVAGFVDAATLIGIAFWLSISLAVFVAIMLLRVSLQPEPSESVDWRSVRAVLKWQRATLLIIAVYCALLLIIPFAVDQTGDALRSLSFTLPGVAQSLFLVAGAALLSATVLGAWRVTQLNSVATEPTTLHPFLWFVAAGGLALFGGIVSFQIGYLSGIVLLAGLVAVIGILELVHPTATKSAADETGPVASGPQFQRIVAALPMVILGLATILAGVDLWAGEDGTPGQVIWPVATGVALLALALVISVRRGPAIPERLRPRVYVGVVVLSITAVLITVFSGGPGSVAAVVAGGIAAVAMVVYLGFTAWAEAAADDSEGVTTAVTKRSGWTVPAALIASLLFLIAVHFNPVDFPRTVGSLLVITVFLAGVVAIGSLLTSVGARLSAPGTLRWFGVARLPVLSVLLVWWVLAGIFANPALHNIRTIPLADDGYALAETDSSASPTLEDGFDDWVSSQPESSEDATARTVPLVLVASHGGGIRAAYWTGLVMDCVVGSAADIELPPFNFQYPLNEEQTFNDGLCTDGRREKPDVLTAAGRIFIASGVSGGAVGLAAYSEELIEGEFEPGWVDARLADDFLAPDLGWALFHDLPNHVIGVAPDSNGECTFGTAPACVTQDRAAVLEESFAGEVETTTDRGLRQSWLDRESEDADVAARAQSLPILAFNSSTTGVPHRAVTSPVALGGPPDGVGVASGAVDVGSMLCSDRDLSITTAALLAARFPIVSPSGVVSGDCASGHASGQLADGGYLENSGSQTLVELLPELTELVEEYNASDDARFRIAIVAVDIDNEYTETYDTDDSAPIGETLVPLQLITGGGPAYEDAAVAAFAANIGLACYVAIRPELLPGVRAPLGWTLSDSTRESLQSALTASFPTAVGGQIGYRANQIRIVQNWLEKDPEVAIDSRYEKPLDSCVPGVVEESE